MATIYMYRDKINDDRVFISIYSDEVEELATNVQESLKYQTAKYGYVKLSVLGLVEVEARNKASEELAEQGLCRAPKYHKPVTEFYSGLIKDELLRRLA